MIKKLIIVLTVLLLAVNAFGAAGSWTDWTRTRYKGIDEKSTFYVISSTFTAGTAGDAGSVPNKSIDVSALGIDGTYCFLAVTNPGTTAPTDNYDIVVNDDEGVDIFGAELNNRDTANSEQAVPKIGSVYGSRAVSGDLTIVTTNNSVASSTCEIKIFFAEPR